MFSTDINHWLQTFDSVAVKWLFNFITLIGFVPFLLLTALIIIAAVNLRYGFFIINFLGWTVIVTVLLKEAINYPRPLEVDETLQNFLLFSEDIAGNVRGDNVGKSGFPSGHTSFQTAIWIGLSLLIRRRWLWLVSSILILLTIISRMYLAHHFLADVIAGFGIGFFITLILYLLIKKIDLVNTPKLTRIQQLFFLAPLLMVIFYPAMPVAQLGRFIGLNLSFLFVSSLYGIPSLSSSTIKRIMNVLIFIVFYALFFAISVWITIPDHGLAKILLYTIFNFAPIVLGVLAAKKIGLIQFRLQP